MFLTFWSVLYDQIIWQFSNAIVHRCSLFYLEKLFTLEENVFNHHFVLSLSIHHPNLDTLVIINEPIFFTRAKSKATSKPNAMGETALVNETHENQNANGRENSGK